MRAEEHRVLRVFDVMRGTPRHRFQVVTKRAARLAELAPRLGFAPNIWMGVSVENEDYVSRIEHLRRVPAAVRFLSVEPMLGPISNLDLDGIHWVIVGGESGRGARPMNPDWGRSVRDQCLRGKVAFFFKQWGAVRKAKTGRLLDGRTWDEIPSDVAQPAGDAVARTPPGRRFRLATLG